MSEKTEIPKLIVGKSIEREIQKGTRLIYGTVVKKTKGEPKKGELVWITDENGKFLAQGFANPKSAAVAQILSLNEKEKIDEEFFRGKIFKANFFRYDKLKLGTTKLEKPEFNKFAANSPAITERLNSQYEKKLLDYTATSNAYRLFYGETDEIPGLLIDRFNNICSMQISCPGVESWKQKIAEILLEIDGVETVVERNDSRNRVKLGLPILKGVLAGGKKTQTVIEEGKVKFEVDALRGHKTGFYLDQRENRIAIEQYCPEGSEMLDVFSYTGGFGLHAAVAGAKVTMVDLPEALAQAKRNAKLNKVEDKIKFMEGDAFEQTQKINSQGKKFDAISCDPPAFIQKPEDLEKGKKAYHQINYNCLKLVKDGGILVSSSCSHFLELSDFIDILIAASANAGKRASLMEQRFQARDHLTPIASKKGNYLKCIFLRIEDK